MLDTTCMDSGNSEYIIMQIMNKKCIFYMKIEYLMELPHSQH